MKKLLILLLVSIANFSFAQKIEYTLKFENPQTHYVTVEMKISGLTGSGIDLKMPVWAPGSYLVREFEKAIDYVKVKSGNKDLKCEKTNKNTWHINLNKSKDIIVEYSLYAFELSVRTSFIDAEHAYLNGSSIFLYIDGKKNLPGTVEIIPFKDWKKISCGLERDGSDWKMKFPNYDILADSPMEIGNQYIFYFETSGCKYEVAMFGEGNYDEVALKRDMAKVIDEAVKVYGENPNKNYVFIIHNLTSGGGGLEHLNSTTLEVNRWTYSSGYISFLSLVAHEYFHLWNVKRSRPLELGPFNYDEENYTTLLWVMEGFTSYYDELLLLRTGFYTEAEYVRSLNSTISSMENQPGTRVQSAAMSSYDAWIKGYRTNENSYNTEISYYTKGTVLGALLDMEIIRSTNGEKHLDDLMAYVYNEYAKKKNRGFTADEFKLAAEFICGKKLDDFFDKYVYGLDEIAYENYLSVVGYELLYANNKDVASLGVRTKESDGKLIISTTIRDGAAWKDGLNVNDEIIAIDDYRMSINTLNKYIGMKKPNDKIKVTISRDNIIKNLEVTLLSDAHNNFKLSEMKNADEKAVNNRKKWLGN